MEMVGELGAALDDHRDLGSLKLVVLRGAGGNFSPWERASVPAGSRFLSGDDR